MRNSLNLRHVIATALAGIFLQEANLPARASLYLMSTDSSIAPNQGQLIAKNKNKGERKSSSSSSSTSSPQPEQKPRRQRNGGEDDRSRQNSRNGSSSNGGSSSSRRQQPKVWKGFNKPNSSRNWSRGNNNGGKDKSVYKNSNITNINKRVSKKVVYRGGWGRRQGWVGARPWGYGWYGGWGPGVVVYPGWEWWGGLAPSWGVVSLSPTVVIQTSVDEAVSNDEEAIPVANTEFRVYHGSIKPISNNRIEFNFEFENEVFFAKADCRNGLLNDETPAAAEEAELMHSACTIAYNSFDEA